MLMLVLMSRVNARAMLVRMLVCVRMRMAMQDGVLVGVCMIVLVLVRMTVG